MSTSIYVGLHGKRGAGKDTVARMMLEYLFKVTHVRVHVLSFAGALREAVERLTGGRVQSLDTVTEEHKAKKLSTDITWDVGAAFPTVKTPDFANKANAVLNKEPGMTVGRLLQIVGTEIARDLISTNHWVDAIRDKIQTILASNTEQGVIHIFIFTDVRFPNEYEYIRSQGERVLTKILRDAVTKKDDGRSSTHPSETALDHLPATAWNTVLHNNGTLDDLRTLVCSNVLSALRIW